METLTRPRPVVVDRDREHLDELDRWLEWMATQPAAERMPLWLESLRRLRSRAN